MKFPRQRSWDVELVCSGVSWCWSSCCRWCRLTEARSDAALGCGAPANRLLCTETSHTFTYTRNLSPNRPICFCTAQTVEYSSPEQVISQLLSATSTQRPTLPSRPSIKSFTFTWWGLETSSWSPSRSLDRPTPQRHWICSCQPLETGHSTGPWWSDATAWAGYAMTTTTSVTCHVGSHNVTFHPTQVNSPGLTTARQTGTRFTYPKG